MRILLVEDSIPLADQLMPMLREHGYAVDWLADGRDAVPALSHRFDEDNLRSLYDAVHTKGSWSTRSATKQ